MDAFSLPFRHALGAFLYSSSVLDIASAASDLSGGIPAMPVPGSTRGPKARPDRRRDNAPIGFSGRDLIVNGTEAPVGRYAYQVSLSGDGDLASHYCGGSLIAPDLVLTAAHCANWPGPYYRADVDQHDQENEDEPHEYFITREPVLHPLHVLLPGEFDYDFAIVPLYGIASTPPVRLNLNPNLPRTSDRGRPLTVFGWGVTDEDVAYPQKSSVLVEAQVGYIPNEVCAATEGFDEDIGTMWSYGDRYITDRTMCAHDPDEGSCLGDSGGPLIIRGDSSEDDLQVGLVSFGLKCGHDVLPGVYARVSAQADWIAQQVCALSSDPPAYFGCDKREEAAGSKTLVTVEIKLGVWLFKSTGWLLENADGKTVYAYRGTQTYGYEYYEGDDNDGVVVTETVTVDKDQEYRFVILQDDSLGFCCGWWGDGYYRIYEGDGTKGNVLLSGNGDVKSHYREETFVLGNPVASNSPPTPDSVTPFPPSGTAYVTVVIENANEFIGGEFVAWGIRTKESRDYVGYRPTRSYEGVVGTVTERVALLPRDRNTSEYTFVLYNVEYGWYGNCKVYMGRVEEGLLLFSGPGGQRYKEETDFVVLDEYYEQIFPSSSQASSYILTGIPLGSWPALTIMGATLFVMLG